MAITFFGVASTPADGASATNITDPTAVTPPGSMVDGDLVFMYACKRNATGTCVISNTGGQTWTELGSVNSTGGTLTSNMFWCRFNGTWGANPSISFSATTNNTVVMLVFRPTSGSNTWGLETGVNISWNIDGNVAAAATITVGMPLDSTPDHNDVVVIAVWNTDDDNTWGTLTGTGWSKTGLSAQYRNTSGSDTSVSLAYNIKTSISSTVNPAQTEATLGNDGGSVGFAFFYEIVPIAEIPNKIYKINQAINRSNTY